MYSQLAMAAADFVPEQVASILIANGETEGLVPAYVVPDVTPELEEKFSMQLKSVELVDSDFISSPNFVPSLGNITVATLVIAANQNPHGLFALRIRDDNGTLQRDVVVMPTNPGHSVQLYVQRSGEQVGCRYLILARRISAYLLYKMHNLTFIQAELLLFFC